MAFQGYIDICLQSHVAGWAADSGGRAAPVTVRVNGLAAAGELVRVLRADLPAHGVSEGSGFSFGFAPPLNPGDVVELLFADGSHLGGSPCGTHTRRLLELLDGIAPEMEGMEIGPLDRPIMAKSRYRVSYVDHATREELIEKYKFSGSPETLTPEKIVVVDIVWAPGKTLAQCISPGKRYQYCVASHVIEHIGDPVGWLRQMAEVLGEGGLINLAVPDKERTFDHLRAVSLPADLIDSYVRKVTRPTARHVFDHITTVSQIGTEPKPVTPEQIREAYGHAISVETEDRYVDVHCHVFTQDSFLRVFETVAHTGILPLKLRRFFNTRSGANEFIVSLEVSRAASAEIAASYRNPVRG